LAGFLQISGKNHDKTIFPTPAFNALPFKGKDVGWVKNIHPTPSI
jgi:hypothetical protein